MNTKQALLTRLDEIGHSLAHSGQALALFGLGSVGVEVARVDEWSDLDFFAIAAPGFKQRFIDNLDWLGNIRPLAWHFRNTIDGHKVLFEDGIFCEFAVFEIDELPNIAYAPGRMIWKKPEVPDSICLPSFTPKRENRSTDWLVDETLGNLYVGMARYKRGEKLSGFRFVQVDAVNRVMELAAHLETAQASVFTDIYANERRFEQRFTQTATALPDLMQGYARTPRSALAILAWLQAHFAVNTRMASEICSLCGTD